MAFCEVGVTFKAICNNITHFMGAIDESFCLKELSFFLTSLMDCSFVIENDLFFGFVGHSFLFVPLNCKRMLIGSVREGKGDLIQGIWINSKMWIEGREEGDKDESYLQK
jgi:hypothetical protein